MCAKVSKKINCETTSADFGRKMQTNLFIELHHSASLRHFFLRRKNIRKHGTEYGKQIRGRPFRNGSKKVTGTDAGSSPTELRFFNSLPESTAQKKTCVYIGVRHNMRKVIHR
jgi:hypothetical protein